MSSKVAILIAIVIGVLAAVFIHSYLNQQKLEDAGKFEKVMKVVRTVPAGGKLSSNDFEEVQIPRYAYSSNMQVTPEKFKLYKGSPVKNQCDAGKFLTMADLAAESTSVETDNPEGNYTNLPLTLSPAELSGLSLGCTVMLVIQEPIRNTSGVNREAQDNYRHTLVTNLIVAGLGDRANRSESGGSSSVMLKVPIMEGIAISNLIKQNRDIRIIRYNPQDPTMSTDKVIITFDTKTASAQEILEKLKTILKPVSDEE